MYIRISSYRESFTTSSALFSVILFFMLFWITIQRIKDSLVLLEIQSQYINVTGAGNYSIRLVSWNAQEIKS